MKFAAAILFCLFLFSCKDEFENPSSDNDAATASRYFPLSADRYIIYEVDSIIHEYADDNTSTPDSLKTYFHYQIKERIDSSFIDYEGQKAWYVSRYKRTNDTLPWQFLNIETAQLKNNSAQTVEDNVRFIKLSFPMMKNKKWNGNAYNTLPEETYSYDGINTPASIGGFDFDSSATVIQNKEYNQLYQVLKQEKYVCGVGMVFKEKDSLNLNGLLQITNGVEYRMTLKDYFPK